MTTKDRAVKNSVAPLKNVSACLALLDTLMNRPWHLPGIGVFSGPSGYGKTVAGQFCQNKLGATYLEARSFWAGKAFCESLLRELGVARPRGTIAGLMEQAIHILGDAQGAALIIDEADKLVDKGIIELVRDLHETAQVPILLIGEEALPQKLTRYERVHNRVLDWALAQPCDLEDTRALAEFLVPKVAITDELLEAIRDRTGGRARRIATTLHEVEVWARHHGVMTVDAATYDGRVFDGRLPSRHRRAA